MTTRIGLVSDVHSSPQALQQALDIFRREAVDDIICAGDIAGYHDSLAPTVELLIEHDCKAIAGNHDQDYLQQLAARRDPAISAYLQALPLSFDLDIEGRRIFVVHANPPQEQHGGIKLLDPDGQLKPERMEEWDAMLQDFEYDLLIVGHTHQVYAERLGGTLVVNPGSTVFNHCCAILSLPDLAVQFFNLGKRDIVKCWNFSMLYSEQ